MALSVRDDGLRACPDLGTGVWTPERDSRLVADDRRGIRARGLSTDVALQPLGKRARSHGMTPDAASLEEYSPTCG